jgi:ATP-dependent helicase HrpA
VRIDFPESLPVSAQREAIMQAIARHQVVIVCGETGSGKTTQLPKMALALGRGRLNAKPGERGRLIGHTQPRRIAATTVARRIAQELDSPLGEVVGYKVRFADRLSSGASVKLMTDGILLAETQSDPLLQAYDTLIIDEAHERSLNIDFLLGYLREILPRRPDLKVIVTSATIDADRFAEHFAGRDGPAPVLTVSGRMFPVEQRWRPFEESRDFDLNDAIASAVDELWAGSGAGLARGGTGDILVFLPGEREIREAADHLRRHLAHQAAQHPLMRRAEVLPLFARLSQAEQERVFDPHQGLRIVLATNVAETSLTVPGIRYVIDSGSARVKRYSFRSKVEQLLVEPISQAAANQRAGRCGRVAEGICIRLYDEASFAQRPRFTDPEILRSSLAGVILRMKSLHLRAIDEFPFIDAPQRRAIVDGYQLLQELGAVDEALALTPLGETLARLPLDPRVGRMILEARQRGALHEVLVIASALSVQDVRDRPMDAQAQADAAHARFDDDKSEFSGLLRLWEWLETSRGGGAAGVGNKAAAEASQGASASSAAGAAGGTAAEHKLSNRQWEQLLRQQFINLRRVREWRDIHSQLLAVVGEQKWTPNTQPAGYEALHLSLLAGLLGNVGCKLEEDSAQGEYLGARGIKFFRHPGAHLKKKPGRWIMAAELVETTRLFGRGLANIDPAWLEQVGGHLLKKQMLEPHWEKKAGEVVALERATLYGLVVYNGRRVNFGRLDPRAAREIFIREALVAGEWDSKLPFLAANHKLMAHVAELEHKARRQDVLVDDELIFAFYDAHIPPDVHSGAGCEAWWKVASRQQPRLLYLTREELMRHEAAGISAQAFPKTIRLGGVDCATSYLHEPGDPRDGLSVTVPLFVLNQVSDERCEWLVPGMLREKVHALLKSLPQRSRGRLVPLPESAGRMAERLSQPERFCVGGLVDALLREVRADTDLDVKRADLKLDALSPHHLMHLRVVDEHGRQLGQGRSLSVLKAELGAQARGAFQALAQLKLVGLGGAGGSAESGETLASGPSQTAMSVAAAHKPATSASTASAKGHDNASRQAAPTGGTADQRYTDWSFGELPELMEIRRGGQTLVGFPALVDQGDAVSLSVFDEPEMAAAKHRAGLRRLFALALRDTLKHIDRSIPDLQKMAIAWTQVGKGADASPDALRQQIVDVALERAFLAEPWPTDAAAFAQRLSDGRPRLVLIAQEVGRLGSAVISEHAAAMRKLRDAKPPANVAADVQQQLSRLVHPRFLAQTPWAQLQHLPRYLKAVVLRLDKLRTDPARDAARLAELRPQEQRLQRALAERKGVADARLEELRWLIEELRVSFFAQELRTPQPVSLKRLEKAWAQLNA